MGKRDPLDLGLRVLEALRAGGTMSSGQVWAATRPAEGRHVSERHIVNVLESLERGGWVRRRAAPAGAGGRRRRVQVDDLDGSGGRKVGPAAPSRARQKWSWSLEEAREMPERRLPPAFASVLSDVLDEHLEDVPRERRLRLLGDLARVLMDRPRLLALSKRERRALALVESIAFLCRPYRDVVALDELLGKLERSLGATARTDRLSRLFDWKPRQPDALPSWSRLLDAVVTSIERDRALHLDYRPVGRRKAERRLVSVQRFLRWEHLLYLVVWDHDKESLRALSLSRCEGSAPSNARRIGVEETTLEDFVHGPFGVFQGERVEAVSILFAESVVRYAEELAWHPTQRLERLGNGARLRLDVPITEDLVGWILRFRGEAVPEGPPDLVRRVREAAERLRETCGGRRGRT